MIRSSIKIYLLIVMAVFSLEACSSTIRYGQRSSRQVSIETRIEDLSEYEDSAVLETQTGIASFYSDKYHGKIAYSGEVYDMNGISAAHPSYQMGTILRVTNLDNGKSIILRVNDKMPQHPERIIDLSLGAAKELGFVNKGLTEVKLEVLEWGKGKE